MINYSNSATEPDYFFYPKKKASYNSLKLVYMKKKNTHCMSVSDKILNKQNSIFLYLQQKICTFSADVSTFHKSL